MHLNSEYEFVEEYPSEFAMWFKTNSFPNESSYELRDNQGNLISAQGLITSPGVPPGFWPLPSGILPSGGFSVVPLNVGPIAPVCPTTNPYNYSWSITPGGSTAGISTPNSQTTAVTTATTQDYQVIATGINNPGCVATGGGRRSRAGSAPIPHSRCCRARR